LSQSDVQEPLNGLESHRDLLLVILPSTIRTSLRNPSRLTCLRAGRRASEEFLPDDCISDPSTFVPVGQDFFSIVLSAFGSYSDRGKE
jgi:hypothetical protein